MARGTLLAALMALAGACGDTTVTQPTTLPPLTETFTGTLNPSSAAIHSFTTLTGGSVVATLTGVQPDATKTVGFSLGIYNLTLNSCTVIMDNPSALQAFAFNATASSIGAYCVRIYDNGNAATDATPYTYTITVVHPQ
jgi:hypothetical protein